MFTGSNGGYQQTEIVNDGFWPNILVGDFERLRSTPMAQDDERITHALVNAVASVNLQLAGFKAGCLNNGYQSVAQLVALPTVNGKNRIEIQYQTAVFAMAKADLLPDFATVHQRKEGERLAERSADVKNELLAESERIIRNILGKHRAGVALI